LTLGNIIGGKKMYMEKLLKKIADLSKKDFELKEQLIKEKAILLHEMICNGDIMIFDYSTGKTMDNDAEINVSLNGHIIQLTINAPENEGENENA
jgi:hypothetical protein